MLNHWFSLVWCLNQISIEKIIDRGDYTTCKELPDNATVTNIDNTPESLSERKFLQKYEIPEKIKFILSLNHTFYILEKKKKRKSYLLKT